MNQIVETSLGIMVANFTNIYVWSMLLRKRPNFLKINTYVILFLMCCVTFFNYFYNNQFLRIVTITILMSFFLKFMFKEKLKDSILAVLTSQALYMISEIIFALGLIYIFNVNPNDFVTIYFGKFLTNLIIGIIIIILAQFKFVKKFYYGLKKITDKVKSIHLVVLMFFLMVAANVFTMVLYYDFNFIYIMIFNTILTVICFLIIINSLSTKNKYIEVYDKYNTTLNSLKEYEDILDKYRISNHENKNQLLTIRNMIPKTNTKLISYIDSIVENSLKDNEKCMSEVSKIPAGGLRGLIYSKILLMQELKIKYELNITNQIKTVTLININDSLMLDICKIIGVYLDNSIQEVKRLRKKYILIELYLEDNQLIIKIANNYTNTIEINKLETKGYTTKKDGHGYGLTLAKQIIDNNQKLTNEMNINKNTFSQKLKIKI